MAEIHGGRGDRVTAGVGRMMVRDRQSGAKRAMGGFAVEYVGHAAEETAKKQLDAALGRECACACYSLLQGPAAEPAGRSGLACGWLLPLAHCTAHCHLTSVPVLAYLQWLCISPRVLLTDTCMLVRWDTHISCCTCSWRRAV